MKHFVCFVTIAALLFCAFSLSVVCSAAGTITISWNNFPLVSISYTDDPDDGFESFNLICIEDNNSVIWTSDSSDAPVIPDYYQIDGYRFRVIGYTAGGSVNSNILVYHPSYTLPNVIFDSASYHQDVYWGDTDVSKFVTGEIQILYNGSVEYSKECISNGEWLFNRASLTSALLADFRLSSPHNVPDGASLTVRIRGKDRGNTWHYSANTNLTWTNYLCHPVWSLVDQSVVYNPDYFTFIQGFGVIPPNVSPSLYWSVLRIYDASSGTQLTGTALSRKTEYFLPSIVGSANTVSGTYLKVSVNVVQCLTYRGTDYLSPALFVQGLDGYIASTSDDPSLYHPVASDVAAYVPLIYSGVSQTPIYKYVFSGLAVCVVFAGAVFLMNKVH